MPAAEAVSLYHKGDANSGDANRYLWEGREAELTDEQRRYVVGLDAAMKPRTEPVVLYRGKDYNYGSQPMPTFKVGDRIPQSGFVSTSKRRKTAVDFSRASPQAGTNKDKGGVLFEISIPAGVGTVDVPNAAGDKKKGLFHNEEEVLVERGGELVVTGVTKSPNGSTIVKAEFVPGSVESPVAPPA